jgi:hypothetical protein
MKLIKILFLLFFVGLINIVFGQGIKSDKETISFGESVTLSINSNADFGRKIDFNLFRNQSFGLDTNAIQFSGPLPSGVKFENGILFFDNDSAKTIKFNVFSVGKFSLPVGSDSLNIEVKTINVQDYIDIKEIETVSYNDWASKIYWIIGLGLFGLLAYFLNKKLKSKSAIQTEIIQTISPREAALKELMKLQNNFKFEANAVKDFQDTITNIIRNYIHLEMNIPSKQMLSDQLVAALKSHNISEDHYKIIDEIFSISDLVKFAKAKPGEEICNDAILKSIDFVKNTSKSLS